MSIFSKNQLWSMALYKVDNGFLFNTKLNNALKVFNTKKIRTSVKHVHTLADPFLFIKNNILYLFYESMSVGQRGTIEAKATHDLKDFKELGCVLNEDFHLSYPFVFEHNRSVFMIPETINAHAVFLYKFSDFPIKLERTRTFLVGDYADSSIIKHNEIWYLFTSSINGFEIYYTDDLENGELTAHPKNPISRDWKYQRCGGGPVLLNNILFRIAQDCSVYYGRNINVFKITELTPENYKEELYKENYFECNQEWNNLGGHHFSFADFNGSKIIATDGKQYDYYINKLLSPLFKFTG